MRPNAISTRETTQLDVAFFRVRLLRSVRRPRGLETEIANDVWNDQPDDECVCLVNDTAANDAHSSVLQHVGVHSRSLTV